MISILYLFESMATRMTPGVVGSGVNDPSDTGQSSEPTAKDVVDETDAGAKPYGCPHYQTRCAYVSPCCKKIYTCRVCHDENEGHALDRHAVTEIICLLCNTKQPVARTCIKCGTEFGRYFCPVCRLYDDKDLGQFHCDQCGICRIGGSEKFFHCLKCDLCLGIEIKDSHKCMEKRTHANCPVCLEDLHTSRVNLMCLPCSHLLHKECWTGLLTSGNYACPVCCQSMVDMTNQWKNMDDEVSAVAMPDELRNMKVWILCRDCHQVSETPFHVVGLKCCHCGSYNTCRTEESSTKDGDISDAVLHDSHEST